MKIAYILDDDISTKTGIAKKIESKVNLWKEFGHTVKVFSLRSKSFDSSIEEGVVISKLNLEAGFKKKFLQQFKNVKSLDKYLSDYNPDMIYIRQMKHYPNIVKVLKKNAPYIVEINTNDIEEAKLSSRVVFYYKKLTRNFLLQNASGFLSVSHELIENENFSKFNKPSLVVGNGYDFNNVVYQKQSFSEPAKFVFIGTPGQAWHGVDKVLFLAKKFTKNEFHIIGPSVEILANASKNVIIHGYLNQIEVEEIVASCDIGISTLSLHKKNMNEASPLKSRQYLAQGLAMIIAYEDTDLPDDLDFILSLDNHEYNIKDNLKAIEGFVENLKNLKPGEIIKQSKSYLDYHTKEKERLLFFDKIKHSISVRK